MSEGGKGEWEEGGERKEREAPASGGTGFPAIAEGTLSTDVCDDSEDQETTPNYSSAGGFDVEHINSSRIVCVLAVGFLERERTSGRERLCVCVCVCVSV